MELPISRSLLLVHTTTTTRARRGSCASLYPPPDAPKCSFNNCYLRLQLFGSRRSRCREKLRRRRLNFTNTSNSRHFRVKDSSSLNGDREEDSGYNNIWEDSEFVEVIGVGSRKDAVLDFCLDSPFHSSALRFWNILVEDSGKVQLQQKFLEKDITPRIVEAPLALKPCSKAVILVACSTYDSDHIMALDILRTVKSANGLVVGIILKPFSFEGRRRQDEVNALVDQLQELTNFCIMVDTDALLEKDLVTLDEAFKTANNAVLMAMNAISILISEMHIKCLDVPHDTVKELKVSELKKIIGSHKEAKIGFGAGFNIKISMVRAIYDCPFLGVGLKDLNGIVVCILASSGVIDSSDVHSISHIFRQTTECKGTIVISVIHEPNLEPNLIVTTVITLGYIEQTSQKGGIFSRLAQRFPFIFHILRKYHLQSHEPQENDSPQSSRLFELINSPDSCEMSNIVPVNGTAEGFGISNAELQMPVSNSGDETYYVRDYGAAFEQSEVEFSEANSDLSTLHNESTKGAPTFQRESLIRRNIGPVYQTAQEWASEGANNLGSTSVIDNLSIFKLPVGVKPSEEFEDGPNTLNGMHHPEKKADCHMKAELEVTQSTSWDVLADASSEAIMDFDTNGSASVKGNYADVSKRQGLLSVRAASMLEAERDSQKKWSPIVEIKYRGGIYMGRCQGGLPEGKGRLSLGDGSIYDGMWRYGKRSGLGTFYFSNGDVYRGSWRDDFMHGKGWLYFHTGDRWFVNFWKGKANGEGRFYSGNGDIFFGHFKDGWRHGHFLCINVNAARCLEVWDGGVLVSCKQLDSDVDVDAGAGAGVERF